VKKVFRFFSSIRLAIPLLLLLILGSAVGTFLESRHGIDTAQIWVYQSDWFLLLFILLFVNIFFATLSRIPFQKHHAGFVITHFGLLTLLVGAFLTHQFGIDGTLSVQEGESSDAVLQKERSFQSKVTPIESENPSDQPAVGFLLKSAQFQQIGELLYYPDHTEIDFGPLEVFLLKDNQKSHLLFLYDRQTGDVLKEIDLAKIKKFTYAGYVFKINRFYERAVVGEKGLQEGTQINPAVELTVSKNGKKQKEILFARHPDFQLSATTYSGFQLRYDDGSNDKSQGRRAIGLLPISKEKALVQFYENQKRVESKELLSGKSIQTPWMGIEFTLGNVFPHARIVVERGSKKIFVSKKIQLPFEVKLEEFVQINYPGTQKAKEYKSRVIVKGNARHEISMNNPLKFQDYTIYQSSFELRDGEKPISIFSVSSDPGRFVKYGGSVILAIGIIIYTLMRSRLFQKRKEGL